MFAVCSINCSLQIIMIDSVAINAFKRNYFIPLNLAIAAVECDRF